MLLKQLAWVTRPHKGHNLVVRWKLYRGMRIVVGAILLLVTTLAPSGPLGMSAPASAANWRLEFHDEFNGTTLNMNKWSTTFPWGARTNASNHELEYYSDNALQVAHGILRIRADRHHTHGFNYRSGIITSYKSFNLKYGYVEVRAKVPQGQGFWPAVWLAPHDESWPPEIDILEIQGAKPHTNLMTNHFLKASAPAQTDHSWTGPDFSKGFHTFGLEWSPKQITWYIDGVERFRTRVGIPSKPMYLIANLAVGGDWVRSPDAATRFPGYLEITYIRVYQRP
ncbi:MAG: glycoside hydrolase family 16 protein [Chloroflexota bacterium]